MSGSSFSLFYAAMAISGTMLSLAGLLTFFRLVRGPSLADRVVALDLMTLLVVAITAVYEVATEQPVLLDSAIVLALVAFLGTIAFAQYVERGARNE